MFNEPEKKEAPEEYVEELLKFMDSIIKNEMCNEDVLFPVVEDALNGIYPDAAKAHFVESGEMEPDEDEPMFNATAGQLFEFVEAENRQQFAQDLRNAISLAVNHQMPDEPSDAVLEMR